MWTKAIHNPMTVRLLEHLGALPVFSLRFYKPEIIHFTIPLFYLFPFNFVITAEMISY